MIDYSPHIGKSQSDFFQSDREVALANRRERKWKLKGGKEVWEVKGKVLAVVEVPKGSLEEKKKEEEGMVVVMGLASAVAKRVNLKTQQVLSTYRGHTAPITCLDMVRYHNKEEYLVTGSWDKSVRVWNDKQEAVKVFSEHTDFIKGVAFAQTTSELLVYSGSSDRDIRKWSLTQPKSLATLKGHQGPVEDLKVSLDQDFLFSCSSDRSIFKWCVRTNSHLMTYTGHLTTIYRMYLTEDDIWSVSADKTVRRFNITTGQQDVCLEHPDHVRSLVVTPDLRYLITGCRDEDVYVHDLQTDTLVGTFEGHCDDVTALVFHPPSRTIYSGSLDTTIRAWSLQDAGKLPPLDQLPLPTDVPPSDPTTTTKSQLTEEEERELAELMADD